MTIDQRVERLEKATGYTEGRVPGTMITRINTEHDGVQWCLGLGLMQERKRFFVKDTIEACLKSAETELGCIAMNHKIQTGTILNHSIGLGCNQFWQVTATSLNSVLARRIKHKTINGNPRLQSYDFVPVKDGWEEHMSVPKRLMVKTDWRGDVQIGPNKRMIWWSVWDGKPHHQYSP